MNNNYVNPLFLDNIDEYYSVALIKKNTLKDVYNLGNLQGKKACFAGVGTQAGWNIPIHKVKNILSLKIVCCIFDSCNSCFYF